LVITIIIILDIVNTAATQEMI